MIKYNLKCATAHEFEAWFPSIEDYDTQKERGLVSCPYCSTHDVEKAIMAPAIKKPTPEKPISVSLGNEQIIPEDLQKLFKGWREEVEKNFDYVGDKFADEARAIHNGESDERPIYGETSPKQAKELIEEGIPIAPLPPLANPKGDKGIN